jgi:hypothetical protein
MLTVQEAFNLIKQERKLLGNYEDYRIKISDSNHFERENLIGIYKIRKYTADKNGDLKQSIEIETLITNLENYSGDNLKLVSVLGKKYYRVYYLSQNWKEIVGHLEREIDENNENDIIIYDLNTIKNSLIQVKDYVELIKNKGLTFEVNFVQTREHLYDIYNDRLNFSIHQGTYFEGLKETVEEMKNSELKNVRLSSIEGEKTSCSIFSSEDYSIILGVVFYNNLEF